MLLYTFSLWNSFWWLWWNERYNYGSKNKKMGNYPLNVGYLMVSNPSPWQVLCLCELISRDLWRLSTSFVNSEMVNYNFTLLLSTRDDLLGHNIFSLVFVTKFERWQGGYISCQFLFSSPSIRENVDHRSKMYSQTYPSIIKQNHFIYIHMEVIEC